MVWIIDMTHVRTDAIYQSQNNKWQKIELITDTFIEILGDQIPKKKKKKSQLFYHSV